MSSLIPIIAGSIAGKPIQTVNARDLHAFLQVGRDFSNWINERINAYGFVEGVDYVTEVFANSGEKGGRPRTDYFLSLDMAKELSMVERNEQGKRARQYFIECERRAQQAATATAADASHLLNDPAALRTLLLDYSEKVIQLETENAVLAPKAAIVDAHHGMTRRTLNRFARTLDGLNTQRLKADLCRLGYFYRSPDDGTYRVYAQYRDTLFQEKRNSEFDTMTVYPTTKGCALLVKLYNEGKLTLKKPRQRAPVPQAA